MNKKYYLQVTRRRGPAYFIAIIIIAILYLFFRNWLFTNSYAAPIIATVIVLSVIISNLLTDYNSYLKINNGSLFFYKLFQNKWSLPISEISIIEEHSREQRAIERVASHMGGRPRTGVKITTTSGKIFNAEYGDRLVKYKSLVANLLQLNPNIKTASNSDLANWENL